MTVQELFKKVPFNDFFKAFCQNDKYISDILLDKELSASKKDSKMYRIREKILSSYTKLQNSEIIESDNIIFVTPMAFDNLYYHSFFVKKQDLISDPSDKIERYSYDLTDLKEILGYQVANASIYAFDEVIVAYSIFDEISFYGLPFEDGTQEQKDDAIQCLNEAVAEIKESAAENYKGIDDVFKKLEIEDKRTDAEKIFDKKTVSIGNEFNKKNYQAQFELEKSQFFHA